MLFLGAGASKAVGLPTLPELTQEFRSRFDDPFEKIDKLLREAKNEIDYPESEMDLEVYFTILDSLVEPTCSIRELGPFAVYLYKLLENKEGMSRIKTSRKEIQTLKEKSLKFIDRTLRNRVDLKRANRLYNELLAIEGQHQQKDNGQIQLIAQ